MFLAKKWGILIKKGYSSVSVEQSTINIDNRLTRYALYPVWVLTTRWRDKAYIFAKAFAEDRLPRLLNEANVLTEE